MISVQTEGVDQLECRRGGIGFSVLIASSAASHSGRSPSTILTMLIPGRGKHGDHDNPSQQGRPAGGAPPAGGKSLASFFPTADGSTNCFTA